LHTSSFAVTAPQKSLWLRHNQKIRILRVDADFKGFLVNLAVTG
jgi:hypothetical protein